MVENADGIFEAAPGTNYSGQRVVFNDLGQGVLNNAFEGYNCSLFAYGQTGAGKSYSMVGYGANKGIVPITCDELFKTMNTNTDPNKRYEVTLSMLEIYNEQVRDLLQKSNPKGGLPVRQNPKLGLFYVQGLKKVPVGSYKEVEQLQEQGTSNRTVAATQMNATSSRAHTVVTIVFDQIIKNESGQETKKSSTMNLVDLAGSERADSTGATGDRLKEGANINKSLSSLGNVISALADLSMGKKKVMVPYRDSTLTKLLQNALGGNSKTIMIAALSPADINYDETLGTLRYADRAKKIKNKAVINENPMDKLVRELKEENERLKKAMTGGGVDLSNMQAGLSPEEKEKMRKEMEEEIRAQLLANQEELDQESSSWEDKLKNARAEVVDDGDTARRKSDPHFLNLNEDPMLSGKVVYFLDEGENTIGRKDADPKPKIMLSGLSISKEHAIVKNSKGGCEIKPAGAGAKIKVNGQPLTGARDLVHKDRVLFGSSHLYVFTNPKKTDEAPKDLPGDIDWEYAQKEIAEAKGFSTGAAAGLSKDQQIAQELILEVLPMVTEVNAMSEELNKHRTFEVVLLSAAAQDGTGSSGGAKTTKVMVKMKNLLNGNTWLWDRAKFVNRRFMMQDLYQSWLDGDESVLNIPKEEDPFWEPPEDVLIGTGHVFLQSLLWGLEWDVSVTINDYKGQDEGSLHIVLTPCNQNGKPIEDEFLDEDEDQLKGKPYHFKVEIKRAEIHKARFSKGLKVKYHVYKDDKAIETPVITGTLSPEFKHSHIVSFPNVTDDIMEYFKNDNITFSVYGKQEDVGGDAKLSKLTTKELRQMDHINKPESTRKNTQQAFGLDQSSDQSQLKSEMMLLHRKFERLEAKERRMQQICQEWNTKPASEQDFEAFFRAVSAVANSSGTRLKTRVQIMNRMLQAQKKTAANGNAAKGPASDTKVKAEGGKEKKGSSACIVM
ncbi:unnamed protein product [Owenia fusiformis]|uniref:Kinesin-like protein n=1 Tax=Owenia fusiformis TaxID=6347 RepID=A0A8S4NFH5_OWEFU|nr:unnamed protein product [Owenia fusiformis]